MQNADQNQPNSSLSILSIPVNPPQANRSQNPKRLMRNYRLSLITVILCLVDEKVREKARAGSSMASLLGKGRRTGKEGRAKQERREERGTFFLLKY
jgi:hypothetical protein